MGKLAEFTNPKTLANQGRFTRINFSKKSLGGFTIIELLIATAVFSIVLMAAVVGFLEIGRLYYKGIATNAVQSTTKQVLDRISADFQNSSAFSGIILPSPPTNSYTYFCVGGVRYTLNFDKQLDISATPNYSPTGNFGILRDELPGANACAPPCDTGCLLAQTAFINPQELLANNMRLNALSATPVNSPSQLYNITIRLLSGGDSSLTKVNPGLLLTGTNARCDATLKVSQYCAQSYMSNVVYAGGF